MWYDVSTTCKKFCILKLYNKGKHISVKKCGIPHYHHLDFKISLILHVSTYCSFECRIVFFKDHIILFSSYNLKITVN